MSRCWILVLAFASITAISCQPGQQQLIKNPNVLFISIDDLNDWVEPLRGHPQALTPQLEGYHGRNERSQTIGLNMTLFRTDKPFHFLLMVVVATLVGCGTIMHGTTQEISFRSTPSNANITVNGMNHGATPVVIDLKRKNTHLVKIELDGYLPYETTLARKTSGWVWGNIILGGLVGLAVDAVKGGMYKLTPEQVEAPLNSDGTAMTAEDGQFLITVVMNPDPNWERIGNLEAQ